MTLFPSGKWSQSVFGTATTGYVDKVSRAVRAMQGDVVRLNEIVFDSAKELAALASVTTQRLDVIQEEIALNHRELLAINAKYQKITTVQFNQVTSLINKEARLTALSTQFSMEAERLYEGVNNLLMGKLSPHLIPFNILQGAINRTEKHIQEFDTDYTLAIRSPSIFYKNAQFLVHRNEDDIYIMLRMPIIRKKEPLTVYEIRSFPLPLHNATTESTEIVNIPKYVAVSTNNQEYMHLTEQDLKSCFGEYVKYCSFNLVTTSLTKPSCPVAVMHDMRSQIPEVCDTQYTKPVEPKPFITQLDYHRVLISNINQVIFSCTRKVSSGYDHKTLSPSNLVVLEVPCYCSIRTEFFSMEPRINNCNNNFSATSVVHPINIAYAQYFLTPQELSNIQGNTLFQSPRNLSNLPDLSKFNDEYDKLVGLNKDGRVSMKVVRDSIIEKSKVYPSFLKMMIGNFLQMKDELIETPTGIMALTGVCVNAVIILALIAGLGQCIKLCRKIRRMEAQMNVILDIHHNNERSSADSLFRKGNA